MRNLCYAVDQRVIVKPSFLLVFWGTGLVCALAAGFGWQQLGPATFTWTAGGMVYLAGNLGATIAFNIPLNNRLEAADPANPEGLKI